ncbi:MAG: D-alanyl-D-alanine carboxypeptidase family protein [Candidatus Coproplasma sp.]
MFKKFTCVILSLTALICCSFALFIGAPASSADADGVSEIVMELDHDTLLYGKNVDRKLPMASTTKIMTALLICEDCNLDEVITVPKAAVGIEGSSIYLKEDEVISVRDLLYGLMLVSGNDAACALAIHHSKSVESFVVRMNERANELGANNTNFVNPNGLPDDDHYTTALDLCKIACAALKNGTFAQVVSTKHYKGEYRCFTNKNRLLNSLEGANGVKTGYTVKAGRCLVSSAKRQNMQLVCVVLNCYDMFERSAKLINESFENFSVETVSKDRIFNYMGQFCSLSKDCSFVVDRRKAVNYSLCAPDTDDSMAKLNIYNEKNLIFSENLFTIK